MITHGTSLALLEINKAAHRVGEYLSDFLEREPDPENPIPPESFAQLQKAAKIATELRAHFESEFTPDFNGGLSPREEA